MPTKDEHINQALRNEALAERLDTSLNPTQEWRVTLLFYAALHWVEAYLSDIGIGERTHTQRRKQIAELPQLSDLYHNYHQLQRESENARYDCKAFGEPDVLGIRDSHYHPVKQHIQTLL
ncbi:MAG: hypothetical protein HW403_776 [Dehalococcoidia bacterium]|nr:hypothetical protein [Dehalococcoidia bacterium]